MTDDDRHAYENQIVNFFLQNLPPVSDESLAWSRQHRNIKNSFVRFIQRFLHSIRFSDLVQARAVSSDEG